MTSDPLENRTPTPRRNRDTEVMSHAIAVMSQRGYAATSVQAVADRVGVLKGSLYHYFTSKEELLFRILDDSFTKAETKFAQMKQLELSPGKELMTYLRTACSAYLDDPDRANIFFTEARHLTGANRANIRKRSNDWFNYILDLVTRSLETGEATSTVPPVLLTKYIIGALNNVRTWHRGTYGKQFDQAAMEEAFIVATAATLGLRVDQSQT